MKGTVFLIGAGPGDAGLTSRRAIEVLAAADVVVYDRLIPQELLGEVSPRCRLVDVGKAAGEHTMRQDDINALLVREALQGNVVARLKGGDPFLFGRGGEEADHCRELRVPFEVVPGVTSAFAVPAYAGIPVTHRDVSQHVTVVTASAGRSGTDDPDFAWLAQSAGTVVLLMGLRRVRHVALELMAHGAPPSRAVAVISRGTTPAQRTVVSTLADIADDVEAAQLQSPAIIVVGDVVRLRDRLDWFERRPLFGLTVTVTRARAQASELVTMLRELGAEVIECPLIRIEALPHEPLDREIGTISARDFVIFTSRNGAEIFFERLAAARCDARALHGVRVVAIGTATAQACGENGIVPDVVPPAGKRTSEGLLEVLGDQPLYGSSVLIVRAETGSEQLVEGLRERGARVDVLPVYRNVVDIPPTKTILAALTSDFVTFTAASTVRNLAQLVPEGAPRPRAITIGPMTTQAARQHGFEVAAEADEPSVGGVVVALLQQAQSELAHTEP